MNASKADNWTLDELRAVDQAARRLRAYPDLTEESQLKLLKQHDLPQRSEEEIADKLRERMDAR